MCGIAGVIGKGARDSDLLASMAESIMHRGPDDQGIWADAESGVALVFRRLAIVDLTPAGRQPMHSSDGRFVLIFNGEIYNHLELRKALEEEGAVPDGGWRGHSDTEVFLQAILSWNLDRTLERTVGMFAFALFDRRERTLRLVRDRFGEKPLYYGWAGRDFVFGSELKALRTHPDFDNQINRRALGNFVRRKYIPAPLSIYERIFKLPPGCILTVPIQSALDPLDEAPAESDADGNVRLTRYWSYRDVVRRGLDEPISDEVEAVEELERALARSIAGQSMADVPVGAFLSGGIDSSTVVALYQKYSSIPVRTFSIGFEEAGYNEAKDARKVAAHLGTIHQDRYVTVREARDVIPLLPAIYDEPFADSSQIPTFLVSRFAREHVTVALTGDGGDELFGGYNRHFSAPRLWERLRRIPRPLRAAAGLPLSRVPASVWNGAAALLPGRRQPHLPAKTQKAMRLVGSVASFDEIYCSFLDEWSGEQAPVVGAGEGLPFDLDLGARAPDAVKIMYCDAVTYLPDDILCKVDRASMAVSLETRVPFLDHRVAELAARIPLSMKIRDGRGKSVVRKLLHGLVPRDLVERPKAGFAIPVGEWIKGPLRLWAEDLIDARGLRQAGWFDPELVRRRWDDHLSGRRDSTEALWAILMFQAWLKEKSGSSFVAAA
jgi:asparagine synthase (glutamine-hydrolysing)